MRICFKAIVATLLICIFLMPLAICVPATVRAEDASFYEPCNTVNQNLWSTYWTNGLPIANGNGEWLFTEPAGQSGIKQANWHLMTGYGTYEVRLKTTERVDRANWYIFLYAAPNGEGAGKGHMELDLLENWGGGSANEYTVCVWVNGTTGGGGVGYWYLDTLDYGVTIDDQAYHIYKYVYTSNDILAYVDNIKIFQWTIDCTNKEKIGMPLPPMQFMIGLGSKSGTTEDFTMTIDYIRYTAIISVIGPTALFNYAINGNNVTFDDKSIPGSSTINRWQWNFGDDYNSFEREPVHEYPNAGTYTVVLTVTDSNYKTSSIQHKIIIFEDEQAGPSFYDTIEAEAGLLGLIGAAAVVSFMVLPNLPLRRLRLVIGILLIAAYLFVVYGGY